MSKSLAVSIRSICSAGETVIHRLVEISMKGNRYSLDDRQKYDGTRQHFTDEFNAFDGENEIFLIAEFDDLIIGFARVCRKADQQDEWWVMGLEVVEGYRNQGVGTQLLMTSCRQACSRGGTSILTFIRKTNTPSLRAADKASFCAVTEQVQTFRRPHGQ